MAILTLILVMQGCSPELNTRLVGSEILGDRQAVALDYTSPSYRFDGRGGSLLPIDGWAPAESGKQPKDTAFFAWAIRRQASLIFLRPPGSEFHFFARAKPIHWPNAPTQVLTVVLNGTEVATIPMVPGWEEYRAAIDSAALVEGLNRLELRFSHAQQPSKFKDTQDDRLLSCAVSDIALIPAATSDPWALLDRPRIDPERRIAEIPVSGGFSIPLPANGRGTFRLGPVTSKCPACSLTVEISSKGNEQRLWRGPVETASDLEVSFRTPGAPASFLGLRVDPPDDPSVTPQTKVLIQLRPDYLEISTPVRDPGSRASPGVFVYLIDTLRADALEPYGASLPTSPRISRFSQRAVTFLEAWAPSSWTLPSVASLFTGLFPSRHQMGLAEHKLPGGEIVTLAQLLSTAGHQTLGISQSHVASGAFGLDSGFDHFLTSNQLNGWQLRSQEVRRFLLTLLAVADEEKPLFSYTHTVDPHAPYFPRGNDRRFARDTQGKLQERQYRPMVFMAEDLGKRAHEVEHLRALYLGEVLYADRQFGLYLDLLAQLSLLDDNMVVLLSDHGEEFGEHGGFDHGRTLYQEMLKVPLMIQFPNLEWAGERVQQRVSLLDVLPTILLEAGIFDIELDGRALRPDLLAARPPHPVIAETHTQPGPHRGPVDLQALVFDRIKCIHSSNGLDQFSIPVPEWRAFELENDPEESRPLGVADPNQEHCLDVLANWLEARAAWEGMTDDNAIQVDDEALEELRALGYIQ